MSLIEFKDVVRYYNIDGNKQYAVNKVNFKIEAGKFVVILGQSGAGKSTILNMLGGMDTPNEGQILIDGKEVSKMNDKELANYRANYIGFIFQFYNLLPGLTVYENVAFSKDIVKNALDPHEMIELVGLKGYDKKFPSQLSGGEQQRVSIARALSKNTPIILGDEPTGALDSETGGVVLSLLYKMCKEFKKTVIIVTHNAELGECADFVIRMKNGKVKEMYNNEHPKAIEEVEW